MPRVRLIKAAVNFNWLDFAFYPADTYADGGYSVLGDEVFIAAEDRIDIHHQVSLGEFLTNEGLIFVYDGGYGFDPSFTVTGSALNAAGGVIRVFDYGSLTAPTLNNYGTIEVGFRGSLEITTVLNNFGDFQSLDGGVSATELNNGGDLHLSWDTVASIGELNNTGYVSILHPRFAHSIGIISNTGTIDVIGRPWVLAGLTNNTYSGGGVLNGILDGGAGNDTFTGGATADHFRGGPGNDSLSGGDGNDTLAGGADNDLLNGGNGADTVTYANDAAAVTVMLATTVAQNTGGAGLDTITGIENAIGSAFADFIDGSSVANALSGGAGNDRLRGLGGADTLDGGAGADVLIGGAGADVLIGGDGVDQASYHTGSAAVQVDLLLNRGTGGEAEGDTFSSIEDLVGTTFADQLSGDNAANFIYGLAGADMLWGNGGNDILIGAAGADILTGGAGVDATSYHNSTTGVRVVLFDRVGFLGEAEGDRFGSIENIIGSPFADEIFGDNAANKLYGQQGADTLYGNTGHDELEGGDGGDTLNGEDGNDTLIGGAGQDALNGGMGADRFFYRNANESLPGAPDLIGDFTSAHGDKINLTGIDADVINDGDQAFTFIGSAAFSAPAFGGQLRYAGNLLEGDTDGDGNADFQIQLNVASMQPSDFWL